MESAGGKGRYRATTSSRKRMREDGPLQAYKGDCIELDCASFRQPYCSLILNGAKTVETRKWPIFHGLTGPLAVHCAYHEWEGGDEIRAWVRRELGGDTDVLDVPEWMQGCSVRGAVVGIIGCMGETLRCVEADGGWNLEKVGIEAQQHGVHMLGKTAGEEAHEKSRDSARDTEARDSAPDTELREKNAPSSSSTTTRTVQTSAQRDSRSSDSTIRSCDAHQQNDADENQANNRSRNDDNHDTDEQECGIAWQSGHDVSIDELRKQAFLREIQGKYLTHVSDPMWLQRPLMMKGGGGVFRVSLPVDLLPSGFSMEPLERFHREYV